jgi:hypothetical protein
MSADVAVIESDVTALEGLDPASREIAITQLLGQAKQFMDVAMKQPDAPRIMSDFKAQIITIAEYAKQKRMSEELQIDSTVMVRRAERGLGVAIREGQERGEIKRKGMRAAQTADSTLSEPPSPSDYLTNAEMFGDQRGNGGNGIYAMTDNVTDDQFEHALTEAVDDRNVSRANVVRKIKGDIPAPKPRKTTPVLSRAMDGISGYRMALEEIHSIDSDLTAEQAQVWVKEIGRTISELGRIRNLVKETAK